MSIIQVTQIGSKFAVTENGTVIANSQRDTRVEAVQFAINYKVSN